MKKVAKVLGWLVLGVILLGGGFASFVAIDGIPTYAPGKIDLKVESTPERVARGKRYVQTLCATCHMDPTTRMLTGKQMLDAPKEFGAIRFTNDAIGLALVAPMTYPPKRTPRCGTPWPTSFPSPSTC